jgi:DNA-directed RNA polymerase specialized sigma24 family protein
MSKLESHPKLCPCGGEPLASHGLHLLGEACCERVRGWARRYFGSNGRFGDTLEDVVQQCYAKLARPGALTRFEPPAGRDRADAFRAFVYCSCKNVCLSRLKLLRSHSKVWQPEPAYPAEAAAPMSPLQAFSRKVIETHAERAVDLVRQRHRSLEPKYAARFDALWQQLSTDGVDYDRLQERFGDNRQTLKQAMCALRKELVKASRQSVQDTLALDPYLDTFSIEFAVDEEIHDLFEAAFPGESERLLDFYVGLEDGATEDNEQGTAQ